MNQEDTNEAMNVPVAEAAGSKKHEIMTAELQNAEGYVAWREGYVGLRTHGDNRWQAIAQLAVHLSGVSE